jgi:flagellin
MLGITAGTQAKSSEKLSSGYKINRAADDAAGLAISEKMRKQIRGLTQASANAEDGISAVQTAEGALNEVHDMLQRMNELAVKAANGTESESDRSAIQDEVDQLAPEIDRVAETTKFNETYLLKGDRNAVKQFSLNYTTAATPSTAKVTFSDTADAAGIKISGGTAGDDAKSDDVNEVLKALRDQGVTVTYDAHWNVEAKEGKEPVTSINLSLNGSAGDKYNVVMTAAPSAGSQDAPKATFSIQTKDGVDVLTGLKVEVTPQEQVSASNLNYSVNTKISAEKVTAQIKDTDIQQYYDADGNKVSENALNDYFTVTPGETEDTINVKSGHKAVYDAVGNEMTISADDVLAKQDKIGDLRLNLHVGADATSNNQISINISAMSAKGLGVNGIKVDGTNDSNALDAIETIKAAITKVSDQRSALGAVQNRLEHTIKNLDNVVENTTAAESQIRDTDMASEMVKYSNNNILTQAGQSMLAQANQSNQGVLSLLG